jgi:hypothetical protein
MPGPLLLSSASQLSLFFFAILQSLNLDFFWNLRICSVFVDVEQIVGLGIYMLCFAIIGMDQFQVGSDAPNRREVPRDRALMTGGRASSKRATKPGSVPPSVSSISTRRTAWATASGRPTTIRARRHGSGGWTRPR